MVAKERRDSAAPDNSSPIRLLGPDDNRTPLEILRASEWCRRKEIFIPFSEMVPETSIVDPSRVAELAADMKVSGQGQNVWLRAREIDGVVWYETIDGFHRREALAEAGFGGAWANVDYNMPDVRFYQERIIATSKKSVEFARVAEWINLWWQTTDWAQRLTARQAVDMTMTNSGSSTLIPSKEERERLRQEIIERCQGWGKSLSYVSKILTLAEDCDPQLMREVRVSKAGRGIIAHLTPVRLTPIVKYFPGEVNYRIQRFIAESVVEGRFSGDQTDYLAWNLSTIINNQMNDEEIIGWIKQAIGDFKIATYKKDKSKASSAGLDDYEEEEEEEEDDDDDDDQQLYQEVSGEDDEIVGDETVSSDRDNIIEGETSSSRSRKPAPGKPMRLLTDAEVDKRLEGSIPVSSFSPNGTGDGETETGTRDQANGGYRRSYSVFDDTRRHSTSAWGKMPIAERTHEDLAAEITTLKEALKQNKVGGWWLEGDFLGPEEKRIMEAIFTRGLSINQAADETKMTLREIGQLINSSLLKHARHSELDERKVRTQAG